MCREGFVDGIPDLLRDWDLIDVPAAEAEAKLAVNVLVLDESTTIVAEETPEVADALAAAGQDVVTTPFAGCFCSAAPSGVGTTRCAEAEAARAIEPETWGGASGAGRDCTN